MFERREDFRRFVSLLARAVHRREIRVFAYCVMQTHYHLLIQVRAGTLASIMQRIQSAYSTYFNRTRHRDGSLVRGRYASRRVKDENYRVVVHHYIELNPREAGLVESAADYEYSSASDARMRHQSIWIERADLGPKSPRRTMAEIKSMGFVVMQNLMGAEPKDRLEQLLELPPEDIPTWMIDRALLADGVGPAPAICSPREVYLALEDALPTIDTLPRPPEARRVRRLEHEISIFLLHVTCGMSHEEISRVSGCSRSTVGYSIRRFHPLLSKWPALRDCVIACAERAFRAGPMARNAGRANNEVDLAARV
jgi:REP element-mobilizing transposase RayT